MKNIIKKLYNSEHLIRKSLIKRKKHLLKK